MVKDPRGLPLDQREPREEVLHNLQDQSVNDILFNALKEESLAGLVLVVAGVVLVIRGRPLGKNKPEHRCTVLPNVMHNSSAEDHERNGAHR